MGDEQFPITFGRYQLTDRLAMGGMAELFIASVAGDHGFAKKVVIKRLLDHLAADPSYRAMFIDEAKLTARLSHPKIAQTFELGQVGEQLFIAMEYIEGIDVLALLRETAQRRQRVDDGVAVWIAHEVLDALDFAHSMRADDGSPMGVVHRDISPSNILLSLRGDIKLVDFGIARASDPDRSHRTKTGTLKGKYGYMSPEQVNEQALDHRSDVFSVGIVLAEMLTGRRLFAAANELDVLLMVRDVKLARLDRYGANVQPELMALLRRALAKQPDVRFATAGAFRDALADWMFQQRIRVANKQIAELVSALRGESSGRVLLAQPAADLTPIESVPEQSGGIPHGLAQGGDSMPVIAISYDEPKSTPIARSGGTAVRGSGAGATPNPGRANTPRSVAAAIDQLGDDLSLVGAGGGVGGRARADANPPSAAVANEVPAMPRTRTGSGSPRALVTPALTLPRTLTTSAQPRPAVAVIPPKQGTSPGAGGPTARPPGEAAMPAPRVDVADPFGDPFAEALELAAPSTAPAPAKAVSDGPEEIEFDLAPESGPQQPERDTSYDRHPFDAPALVDSSATGKFPSIEAAIESLMPVAPDPAAIDFDDSEIEPAASRSRSRRVLPAVADLAVAAAASKAPPTPTIADIAEQPDDHGDFAVVPPLRVLFRLFAARATGLLVVSVGGIKKEIYIRDGLPEHVSSNVASELFGNYLVAKGILSDGELAMSLAMMPHYGGKLGDTLVGLGLLKPLEVFRHLTKQVRQKLVDASTWSKGLFAWYNGRENPREAFPLDLNAYEVLGAGALAHADEVIDGWIRQNTARRPRAVRSKKIAVERFEMLGLAEMLDQIDGTRSIGEIVGPPPRSKFALDLARGLYLLDCCELIRD